MDNRNRQQGRHSMKRLVLLATTALSFLLFGMPAYAGVTAFTLKPGPFQIVKDREAYDQVLMDGFGDAGAPGEPVLPRRVLNLLVPPDVDWESLELVVTDSAWEAIPGTYRLRAADPDAASLDGRLILDWGTGGEAATEARSQEAYGTNAFFPAEFVELLPYSQLRKWKFARVGFRPVQVNPVTGELRLVKWARVELRFQRETRSALQARTADRVMDSLAPALFHNYAEGRADYEATGDSALQAQGDDYVIITTNAIAAASAELAAFIAHKEARGHSVALVTESDFGSLTGQAPNHRAEKIRQWLIQNYASRGIQYVLLIGNPTPFEQGEGDIPMKMCWPRLGSGDNEEAPTDAFYADLTGNWDLDRDGAFGEWSDYAGAGGVDLSMEVWVGRIPVYNADTASLDQILRKTMNYENARDTGWRRNVLLPMSFSTTAYDGAPLAEQMKNDFLASRGYASWTQYQQGSGACSLDSSYPSSEELRGGNVVRDRWAAGPFGIVAWWGHGSVTAASVGADSCWDGNLFSITQAPTLNDATPAFVYQCSCTNGYPENPRNLQYTLLKQGGIATVSASRVSWFNTAIGYGQFDGSSTNSGIGYEYVSRLAQERTAGRSLFEAKLAVAPDIGGRPSRLMNQFDFNLYGDPSLRLGGCEGDADCDDGLWCNGVETCVSGRCAAGPPVDCDDGNGCTNDRCDEELGGCENSCGAAAPGDSCCGDAVCEAEAVCNAECVDEDGDGYGSPASLSCEHPEPDCDDADPDVNPGMAEIQGNGVDEDCRADTPGWGTPASHLGEEYSRASRPLNDLFMLLGPAAAIGLLKRARSRGRRG